MKSKRKDPRVYLEDVRQAIERIADYTASGKRAFMRSEMVQDAVIRQLSIIGEAVSRLPNSLRDRHPDVAWKDAIGMRNVLIHDYSETSIQRVWETVKQDLPPLRKVVEAMLEREEA